MKASKNTHPDELYEAMEPASKEIRNILKKRAALFTEEAANENGTKDGIEIIEFALADEMFAIESQYVREVFHMKTITPLPGVPEFIMGIINVRGQIVTVNNLKKFFNLPEKGLGELNKLIILKNDKMEMGILADVIGGTRILSKDSLENSLNHLSEIGQKYLLGITKDHLIVLDGNNLLNDNRIRINQ